jgi:hypothetical protein
MERERLKLNFLIWKHKREGLVHIRFCHTCSLEQKKLVELSFVEGLNHWLKNHWVREGWIQEEKEIFGETK